MQIASDARMGKLVDRRAGQSPLVEWAKVERAVGGLLGRLGLKK